MGDGRWGMGEKILKYKQWLLYLCGSVLVNSGYDPLLDLQDRFERNYAIAN
jgi:hypothetical protein